MNKFSNSDVNAGLDDLNYNIRTILHKTGINVGSILEAKEMNKFSADTQKLFKDKEKLDRIVNKSQFESPSKLIKKKSTCNMKDLM